MMRSKSSLPRIGFASLERDQVAKVVALVTAAGIALTLLLSTGTYVLMPGSLTSAHGTIEACNSCHSNSGPGSGTGKVSWLRRFAPGEKHADSKACITCHKMPETALNAHGATASALQSSTERLLPAAAKTSAPQAARAQNIAFPTHTMSAQGLECATCHVEHQGAGFKLAKISNAQCQSCHVVKFDSFDGGHPKFEDTFPFRRRTRIVYDHDGHFSKHYPEVAKKDPNKRIPETCATCHDSSADKRIMGVASFDKTCSTCHLDQIAGKGRASGPKGVAFLTLPGIDVQTLKAKNVVVGEWPESSDAALTPFMKVMISRTDRGRALLEQLRSLNLQDLAQANADGIKTAANLIWEIKSIYRDLIAGKGSDVLGNLNIAGGAKLSAGLVADLTASIPRDVLISAQKQWLPNLATEIATLNVSGDKSTDAWTQTAALPAPVPPQSTADDKSGGDDSAPAAADASEPDKKTEAEKSPQPNKLDPPACQVRILGQCLIYKDPGVIPGQSGANTGTASSKATLPPAMQAGLHDVLPPNSDAPQSKTRALPQRLAANEQSPQASKTDELLFPTPDEQREMDARRKGAGKASSASTRTSGSVEGAGAPTISIESSVDPESWAEYGGWYRQDYSIYYSPTGHKDKFIYAWLYLTGPQAATGDANPAAAVFDVLTAKDAQGACTKCHSIDDLQGKGRIVNFSPATAESKRGSFTRFVHEPHFGTTQNGGCLTCHKLEKGRPYVKNYEQGQPQITAANFASVKKDTCQKCHTSTAARQDCMTCHTYHVNGVATPMMTTKLPAP